MPTFKFPERLPDSDLQRNLDKLVAFLNEFAQRFYWGDGSPENVVTAEVGSVYLRLDGGTNTTLYIKEANSDDTGWAAI